MGRSEKTPAVVLAVSAALACLAVTTRLVVSGPMLQATLSGVTVVGAGLLLLRVWAFPGANVSKPVVLTLITLAAVLPELTIGVDSSWGGSGGGPLPRAGRWLLRVSLGPAASSSDWLGRWSSFSSGPEAAAAC